MQLLVAFIECCKAPYILLYIVLRLFFFLHLAVNLRVSQPDHHQIMSQHIDITYVVSGHEIAALRHRSLLCMSIAALHVTDFWH